MTPRRLRQDMTVSAERPDITEATESTEPTDNAEPAEPIDPIDRTEPIDPMDSAEPLHPMQRIESSERIDHFDVRAGPATSRSCHRSPRSAPSRMPTHCERVVSPVLPVSRSWTRGGKR